METNDLLKKATAFAKEGNFDLAISTLQTAVKAMSNEGGHPHSSYIKIIPYYQKAGRYDEALRYCVDELIPAIKRDKSRMFAGKPLETIECFSQLYISEVYSSLELAAKRENKYDDAEGFANKATFHKQEFTRLRVLSDKANLEIDYQEYKSISEPDPNEWPEVFQSRYKELIERDQRKVNTGRGILSKLFKLSGRKN